MVAASDADCSPATSLAFGDLVGELGSSGPALTGLGRSSSVPAFHLQLVGGLVFPPPLPRPELLETAIAMDTGSPGSSPAAPVADRPSPRSSSDSTVAALRAAVPVRMLEQQPLVAEPLHPHASASERPAAAVHVPQHHGHPGTPVGLSSTRALAMAAAAMPVVVGKTEAAVLHGGDQSARQRRLSASRLVTELRANVAAFASPLLSGDGLGGVRRSASCDRLFSPMGSRSASAGRLPRSLSRGGSAASLHGAPPPAPVATVFAERGEGSSGDTVPVAAATAAVSCGGSSVGSVEAAGVAGLPASACGGQHGGQQFGGGQFHGQDRSSSRRRGGGVGARGGWQGQRQPRPPPSPTVGPVISGACAGPASVVAAVSAAMAVSEAARGRVGFQPFSRTESRGRSRGRSAGPLDESPAPATKCAVVTATVVASAPAPEDVRGGTEQSPPTPVHQTRTTRASHQLLMTPEVLERQEQHGMLTCFQCRCPAEACKAGAPHYSSWVPHVQPQALRAGGRPVARPALGALGTSGAGAALPSRAAGSAATSPHVPSATVTRRRAVVPRTLFER